MEKGGSVPFNPHLSKEEMGSSHSFPGSRAGGETPQILIAAFHSVLSKGGAVYMCVNRRLHTNSESYFHSKHFQVHSNIFRLQTLYYLISLRHVSLASLLRDSGNSSVWLQ